MTKLLLVDDDADACALLSMSLSRQGFEVHTAGTLAAASQELQSGSYDAVLVDLELPDGNGRMLLSRGRPAGLKTAIVVSGRAGGEEHQKSVDAGYDAHLVKPIDRRVLLDLLSRAPLRAVPSSS